MLSASVFVGPLVLPHEHLEKLPFMRPRITSLRLCIVKTVHDIEDQVVGEGVTCRVHQPWVELGAAIISVSSVAIAAGQASMYARMVEANLEHRAALDAHTFSHNATVIDVQFDRLRADPVGTAKEVYAALGREMGAAAEAGLRDWLAGNGVHKYGKHVYERGWFGLEAGGAAAAEGAAAFEQYCGRFGVEC